MLEIKHTLCPSCSVGCGINVILEDNSVVGTFPYKRHPVNEGKIVQMEEIPLKILKTRFLKLEYQMEM